MGRHHLLLLVGAIALLLPATDAFATSLAWQHRRPAVINHSPWQMHMGHSHSHHHDHDTSNEAVVPMRLTFQKNMRRQAALFVFSAVAVLGPCWVWKSRITRAHMAGFFLLSLTLNAMESIRGSLMETVQKIQSLRENILKHAPRWRSSSAEPLDPADKVTLQGVVVNVLLSAGKFAVGILGHSSALVADAGHSLSDLFSDFVTLYSVQLARLPPDDDHPMGHHKFEAVGSLFLALTLLVTGLSVGWVANQELWTILKSGSAGGSTVTKLIPTFPALIMAGISIGAKEWLYRITLRVGKALNSQVVIANAWHHRSDAYSSILALFSIGLAMFVPGMVAADSAAGLLVAGMICMTGADVFYESIKQLTDTAVEDTELREKIATIARSDEDVVHLTGINARPLGSKSFMDVTVEIPPNLSSSATRVVEERLRSRIVQDSNVVDATVRANSLQDLENVKVCPLLAKQEDGSAILLPSATEMEADIRRSLLRNHAHDAVVKDVVIHYQDVSSNVHVDVCIQLPHASSEDATPEDLSLTDARALATRIRHTLEDSQDYIQKANVFLDLNAMDKSEGGSASSTKVEDTASPSLPKEALA